MINLIASLLFVLALLLSSCAEDPKVGPKGDAGSPSSVTISSQPLEGYYFLPNGGYLDLYEDAFGLYNIRTCRILMQNSDGSTALVPFTSASSLATVNGTIVYNFSTNYVGATNNVKADVGNAVLNASYITQLQISKSNGVLTVKVITSSSSQVLFNHSVNSL